MDKGEAKTAPPLSTENVKTRNKNISKSKEKIKTDKPECLERESSFVCGKLKDSSECLKGECDYYPTGLEDQPSITDFLCLNNIFPIINIEIKDKYRKKWFIAREIAGAYHLKYPELPKHEILELLDRWNPQSKPQIRSDFLRKAVDQGLKKRTCLMRAGIPQLAKCCDPSACSRHDGSLEEQRLPTHSKIRLKLPKKDEYLPQYLWKYIQYDGTQELGPRLQQYLIQINEEMSNDKPTLSTIYISLANFILDCNPFLTLTDSDEILWYNQESGVWELEGEILIKRICQAIHPQLHSKSISEIQERIRTSSYRRRDLLNSKSILAVKNGVIDFKELNHGKIKLQPHSPDYYLTRKLKWEYPTETKDEPFLIDDVLTEKLTPEDKEKLYEIVGFCLYPEYFIKKCFVFLGPTDTAKTTIAQVISFFLGEENVSNITLQQLTKEQYAGSCLYNKYANIAPDMSTAPIIETGLFKAVTGQDYIEVDKKWSSHLKFKNNAKMIFTANRLPPSILDDSSAYYNRFEFLKFVVPHTKLIPNFEKRLQTPHEMSLLLQRSLTALSNLLRHGYFNGRGMGDSEELYIRYADQIRYVAKYMLKDQPDGFVSKEEVVKRYTAICDEVGAKPKALGSITKVLKTFFPDVDPDKKVSIDGQRMRVYGGITWKTNGEILPVEENGKQNRGQTALDTYSITDPSRQDLFLDLFSSLVQTSSDLTVNFERLVSSCNKHGFTREEVSDLCFTLKKENKIFEHRPDVWKFIE